ncbi:hypothetical protein VOLCADRAFT_87471 [Volvox carteri f. nagariensis]|uniref:SEC7 domain-containing protein n=1 Tax=Volvox carteri f. nagariensis TaxID=3068 RepID=D8TLF1_VOLCA|nr:uncharacterized protein VOLCADRAFT_87471 [Volvox carteri f. nagariensis]EFJ51864.1 hypothetical protein VOLCADRAFT_87471 [Volvox carteri f. nagariensis]|eukprot:XP_002947274.1 hypothetical protein VOLCADRAFT_87471 [Volvox carteri f. nagariensis]
MGLWVLSCTLASSPGPGHSCSRSSLLGLKPLGVLRRRLWHSLALLTGGPLVLGVEAQGATAGMFYLQEEDRNEPSKYDDAFRDLRAEIFKHHGPGTRNVEAAINQIVEDATQCKFESTNNSSDEIVLLNIVQVLGQALESPAGRYLTDESICKAVQAAFMLGDPVKKPKEYGDIMGYYSRQTCGAMIRTVFKNVAEQLQAAQEAEMEHQPVPEPTCRYGVRAAMNILEFLIDLIHKGPSLQGATKETVEEMVVFSLDTIHSIICVAGSALVLAEPLARLVQVELLHAMCQAVVQNPSIAVITGFCQTLLCVSTYLGHVSMAQLETVIQRVLLRLADGKGVPGLEQQEAALEGLLDLVRQPNFVHDMFVNCDCRLERANLFEEVCSLISKTAFPVSKTSVGPLNFISLEALLAVLGALAQSARNGQELLAAPAAASELPFYVDLWGPLVAGQHPDFSLLADVLLAPHPYTHHHHHLHHGHGHHGTQLGVSRQSSAATPGPALPPPESAAAAAAGGGVLSAAEAAAAEASAALRSAGSEASSSSPAGSQGPQRATSSGLPPGSGAGVRGVPVTGPLQLRCAMAERCLKARIGLAVDHFNKDFKKGFAAMQTARLLPENPPAGDSEEAKVEARKVLATRLGQFLRTCPGLNKTTIGELLGDPDPFYLQASAGRGQGAEATAAGLCFSGFQQGCPFPVLESYTIGFDFAHLKFDSALRMFLESFRLPGEAQKIDRIINAFGRHYYASNEDVFREGDAAYVLAYSVIMLNTDQHNNQVKNKMTLESFKRNLRGVNAGTDFDGVFLEEIFTSIVKTPLRLSEPASMDISEQCFYQLAQISGTQRGLVVPSEEGRHLFDTTMFRLIWGPAVHAMCAIVDNCSNESLVSSALEGLQMACQIAAAHELEDVADSIIVNLSKIPLQHLAAVPTLSRADVMFGRDYKIRAVTSTLAIVINKHGDCLRGGWANVLDLVLHLYRKMLLPDSFCKALNGDVDGDGGLVVREVDSVSLKVRRHLLLRQGSNSTGASSIFKHISSSFTQILTLGSDLPQSESSVGRASRADGTQSSAVAAARADMDKADMQLSEVERAAVARAEECLTACCLEDAFTDSKFLKQESLVQLVRAICSSSGPIPRSNSSLGSYPWDVSEVCLELLYTVLLRNRDRITLLWPRAYEHFQTILSHSRECEPVLVQKAIMAMLRLCQRLLPYKAADISEPLMRGIQLLSLVDEQVANDLASTIASEIQSLLQGAAAYLTSTQAWMSICTLIKVIHLDPPSFPVCLDTITWVCNETLSMINFTAVVPTAVDLLERAVADPRSGEWKGHPAHIGQAIRVVTSVEEWLELWWISSQAKHSPEALEGLGFTAFKLDSWHLLLGWLCRLAKNHNVEVRSGTLQCLQRAVVSAEKLAIPAEGLTRALQELLLPLGQDLVKMLGSSAARSMPQCDVTVRELVRALSKMVLLFHAQLSSLPTFGRVWRGILDVMAVAAAANNRMNGEVLAEALPEAAKNMLLVMHSNKILVEGWKDQDGTDLWDYTWRQIAKAAPGVTLQSLTGHGAAARAAAAAGDNGGQ